MMAEEQIQVHLPVAGEHNVYNAAAAAAAMRAIGIEWPHIAAGGKVPQCQRPFTRLYIEKWRTDS